MFFWKKRSLARRVAGTPEHFKLIGLPNIIEDWLAPHGSSITGRRVMDFGCNHGISALGMSLWKKAESVVGVDIHEGYLRCDTFARERLGLSSLPANLSFHLVEPEGLYDYGDRFDLIYSWSVLEHVHEPLLSEKMAQLRDALVPGGFLFIQISPLYYAPEGSHLMEKVAIPWGHLLYQHSEYMSMLRKACATDQEFSDYSMMYETLNRMTAKRLLSELRTAGFEILREYYTYDERPIPDALLTAYSEAVLQLDQIVVLARKV